MRVHRHGKLVVVLAVLVLAMFGFGFALVPIYNSLCKALNINGKIALEAAKQSDNKVVKNNRPVLVQFVATNTGGVPWNFYPKVSSVRIRRGEIAKLAFYKINNI
jgi:cytochrome c oxidase assembly protein subunit 11